MIKKDLLHDLRAQMLRGRASHDGVYCYAVTGLFDLDEMRILYQHAKLQVLLVGIYHPKGHLLDYVLNIGQGMFECVIHGPDVLDNAFLAFTEIERQGCGVLGARQIIHQAFNRPRSRSSSEDQELFDEPIQACVRGRPHPSRS